MGHPRFVWLATCDACRSRAVTRRGEGVQLTSRSGVLKGARSRVVIGENANGGGGLAEQFRVSSFEFVLWRGGSDTMSFATDQHGCRSPRSSKRSYSVGCSSKRRLLL